jgi:hypothetical protein
MATSLNAGFVNNINIIAIRTCGTSTQTVIERDTIIQAAVETDGGLETKGGAEFTAAS